MLLLCVCHLYCLVMLTFRTEVICRYDDNTFGHAPSEAVGVILCERFRIIF